MYRFCRIGITNLICYRNGTILRQHKITKKWTISGYRDKKTGYILLNVNSKTCLAHRVIAHAFGLFDLDSKLDIDHRDRDKTNNCVFNLRAITHQKNTFNTDAKGYYWNKKHQKWYGFIKLNGKNKYLGCFIKEEDARQAYLDAKKIYHII
jgi:hypothetical protein